MSTATVIPSRLARFLRDDFHLRNGTGIGVNSHADVCVMQAADWLAGGAGRTDDPAGVPPTIRRFLIRLNDGWLFSPCRDALKPYAPRVVGLDRSPEAEVRRGFVAADHAVRVFAPTWLRAFGREDWAITLESVAPVVDRDSAIRARDAARRIREVAYDVSARDAVVITDESAIAANAASKGSAPDAALAAYLAEDTASCGWKFAGADADVLRARSLECLEAMIAVA